MYDSSSEDYSDFSPFRNLNKKRKFKQYEYITDTDMTSYIEKLVNNPKQHDIIFKVEDNIIYSYKAILINGSKYFAGMFANYNNSIKLKKNKEPKCTFLESQTPKYIEIFDINHKIFENIIRFITTGRIVININNVIDLYKAAQYYLLDNLINECQNAIINFNDNDISALFSEACKKKAYNPYETHKKYIDNNKFIRLLIKRLIRCSNYSHITQHIWLTIPIDVAKIFMKLSTSIDEINIFEYMINYAKYNSNNNDETYNKILQDLKKFVKLPYVSIKYIHENIKSLKLYSDEDIYEALIFANNPDIYKNRYNEYKFQKRNNLF